MEFSQLRSFIAVAELLHFSKAAERVHLSQPALSIQIRTLEEELGVQLFERSHQKTTLTAAGNVYYEEVCGVLKLADEALSRVRKAALGIIGRLRIGFISTAAAHIVPDLITEFRKTHPDVELELQHALTAGQIAMLESQSIDIGFFRVPTTERTDIKTIIIHQEPFKLFLPIAHPLAERKKLHLKDLDGFDFLVYARKNAPGFHDMVIKSLNAAGATPAMLYEASDMYTMVSLVSAGVGITIAPASVAHYCMSDVVVRDLEGMPSSKVAMAFLAIRQSPVARAFIDLAMSLYVPDGATWSA